LQLASPLLKRHQVAEELVVLVSVLDRIQPSEFRFHLRDLTSELAFLNSGQQFYRIPVVRILLSA